MRNILLKIDIIDQPGTNIWFEWTITFLLIIALLFVIMRIADNIKTGQKNSKYKSSQTSWIIAAIIIMMALFTFVYFSIFK